ncbi:MAG: protein translocase subunit SecD, partial [Methylophilaceae bacterium]
MFTLILGGLFTLPNFFGESPAIQIMPSKAGEKIQFTTQSIVESNLQKNNIEVVGTIIEPTTIKFKFKSPEDQILAKTLS